MFCYSNARAPWARTAGYGCWFSYWVLLHLLLWLAPQTQAQTEGETLSLTSAITQTLNENPALKVFAFRHQKLDGDRATAALRPGYQLGLEAENFAGSGDTNNFDSAEFTLSLSSIIELGGQREARINTAGSHYQYLNAQREVAALELLGEVARQFVSALAAQHRLALARESAQLTEEARAEVNVQSNAGIAPLADLKRAEAAVAQSRLVVANEERHVAYLKQALSAMWGDEKPAFTTVEGDLYQRSDALEFEALFARVQKNPAIEIFAAEERLRAAELRLAKANSNNDILWTVGVRRLEDGNDSAFTAGVSIPLFSGRRNQGATRAATAAKNEVYVQRDVALTKIRTQLLHAYSRRAQAILTVEQLQSDIIPALADALKETQRAYQQGRYRYLDYLSARQEWIAARRTLIDAAAATLTYGAEIEQLTAEPLGFATKSANTKGVSQ